MVQDYQNIWELNDSIDNPLNERAVWHGTRKTHPKLLYANEVEAFDITYSNDYCMWGKGMYYAENASYSDQYCHYVIQNDQTLKYFMLCRIILGKYLPTGVNNFPYQRPPQGYDSIQGYTGGSNIYILYGTSVRRAYPEYEIVYKDQ